MLVAAVAAVGLSVPLALPVAVPATAVPDGSAPRAAAQQAAATEGVRAEAPTAGTCYAMTMAEAYSLDSAPRAPVACTRPHTQWIVSVGVVPSTYDYSGTDPKTSAYMSEACKPGTRRALGGFANKAYAGSTYRGYLFIASPKEQDLGARWFTCTVASTDTATTLRTTTRKTPVKLRAKMPKAYRLCGTKKYLVSCDNPHRVEFAGAARLRVPAGGFKQKALSIAASKGCIKAVGGRPVWTPRGMVKGYLMVACLR